MMGHSAAQSASSAIPSGSPRFRIEEEIARGGMGAVYAATDTSTGERIALKRMLKPAKRRHRVLALFEREYHVLASLDHPSIVRVFEYGVDAEGPYYTMELLDGTDLKNAAPLAPRLACRYLRDVASSLALLHARRLLHRDVSPRNVRILQNGRCKVLDFGALAAFGVSNDVVGTPPAIAPESVQGLPLDQRADLFSLGALAYWTLAGRHAFPARRLDELPSLWLRSPTPPSDYNDQVSAELDQLVLGLLNVDPLARPGDAAEVIDRLNVLGELEPEQDAATARSYFSGTRLVEREREIDRLNRRIQRARAGQGGALLIRGEVGLGKTRLLDEVTLKAQLAGFLTPRCDASAQEGPFSTAGALLDRLLLLAPKPARAALAPHASVLQPLCNRSIGDRPKRGVPSSATRKDTLAVHLALESVWAQLANDHTVAVLVDNVASADPESLTALAALARATNDRSLLLVATANLDPRATDGPGILAISDCSAGLVLRPLTDAGTLELLRHAVGEVPHVKRTARRLHEATHGNPELFHASVRHLVATDWIRYRAGGWTLPLEIPAHALPTHAQDLALYRLADGSAEARDLADLLCVFGAPITLATYRMLFSTAQASSRLEAFEELANAGILTCQGEVYRFPRAEIRAELERTIPTERRAAIHLRIGRALAEHQTEGFADHARAAWHLIRGGQEQRGARLVLKAASRQLNSGRSAGRVLREGCEALEAALEVFRRDGARFKQLPLLVALMQAGAHGSREFGEKYAREALAALKAAIRPQLIRPMQRVFGARIGLKLALTASAVRYATQKQPGDPGYRTALTWFFEATVRNVILASAIVDARAQARFIELLEPFSALGPFHPAAMAFERCRLIHLMSQDHMHEAHAGWERMERTLAESKLPEEQRRSAQLALQYPLGVLEAQRDDDRVVARLDRLEASHGPHAAAIANQLRFLYHGFRGELRAAEAARERVELYALENGTTWQVEIWSTCTLSAVYGNTRDRVGHRRVLEQLAQMKERIPSLEPYWQRAVGAQQLIHGDPASAVETITAALRESGPRKRIGWGAVRSALARAHNELGQHELARAICADLVERMADDRDYVAMNLAAHVELSIAELGLGQVDACKARLSALFERHAPNKNPLTLGRLHEVAARAALAENDHETFQLHLAEMERWFRSTDNPALIAQVEDLRNAHESNARWTPVDLAASTLGDASSNARSILADCQGPQARRRRALELAAQGTGARDAYLFLLGPSHEPELIAQLGLEAAPASLNERVQRLFRDYLDDLDETQCLDALQASATLTEHTTAVGDHLLPLMLREPNGLLFAGVIALHGSAGGLAPETPLVSALASQLYESGDFSTVRKVS